MLVHILAETLSALERWQTVLSQPQPPGEEPDEPPAIGSRTGAGDPPYGAGGEGYGVGEGGGGEGVPVGVGRGQSPFPG